MPYIELIYDDCVCFFGNLENIINNKVTKN